MTLSRSLRKMS